MGLAGALLTSGRPVASGGTSGAAAAFVSSACAKRPERASVAAVTSSPDQALTARELELVTPGPADGRAGERS
jgi:hypothetical protein